MTTLVTFLNVLTTKYYPENYSNFKRFTKSIFNAYYNLICEHHFLSKMLFFLDVSRGLKLNADDIPRYLSSDKRVMKNMLA